METKLYSIYDSVAQTYAQLFEAQNSAVAIRMFSDAVNDTKSQLFHHADDFSLYELASWNHDTGFIVPILEPKFLIRAGDVKAVSVDSI